MLYYLFLQRHLQQHAGSSKKAIYTGTMAHRRVCLCVGTEEKASERRRGSGTSEAKADERESRDVIRPIERIIIIDPAKQTTTGERKHVSDEGPGAQSKSKRMNGLAALRAPPPNKYRALS